MQTVTGLQPDAGAGGSGSGSSGGSELPPAILEVDLAPNPIEHNGPIAVSVTAEHAGAVRLQVDGVEQDLQEILPGLFSGEIPVLTGLENGPHTATVTPRRAELVGEAVQAPYVTHLPEPGSEGFWEAADTLGAQGQVVALGVLPGGDLVELGNYNPSGDARCYLRRRDKGGAWAPDDVVELLAGIPCVAVDLAVDAQGALVVLTYAQGGDGVRWWLARLPAFGFDPEVLGVGNKNETAEAIALHPSGDIAVCGFAPSPMLDDDVMVRLVRPELPGQTWALDYQPKAEHMFWERARDCAFVGDKLVLVGEVHGQHGADEKYRDRLFVAELDIEADVAWHVAPPTIHVQSAGQAVVVDHLGRLIVGGYTCDDDCHPEGELRTYDGATLVSLVSLGIFPAPALAVRGLAWSPARYVVVATGGPKGDEAGFYVRAHSSAQVEPVWSFLHQDGAFNLVSALAVGRFGEVYAGGTGASGYPAVAFIGG